MNMFTWIRNHVRGAILAGVQDALATWPITSNESDPDSVEHTQECIGGIDHTPSNGHKPPIMARPARKAVVK